MNVFALVRRRARGVRLGVKLAWMSAALTAAVVVATVAEVRIQSARAITSKVVDQVRMNQRPLIMGQQMMLAELQRAALSITRQSFLAYVKNAEGQAALDSGLVRTARDVLTGLLPSIGKDLVVITTDSGRVFAAAAPSSDAGAVPATGLDWSRMPAVHAALESTTPADSESLAILVSGDRVYQAAVAPLVQGGFTVGSVLVGERVDSTRLAHMVDDGDIAVLAGGKELAGTRRFSAADLGALAQSSVAPGSQGTIAMDGEDVVVAPLSLGQTLDGAPVTLWLVQSATPTVRALMATLARSVLVYVVLAVILAGLGAALVARSVLRPFDRFVTYMRAGGGRTVSRSASTRPTHRQKFRRSMPRFPISWARSPTSDTRWSGARPSWRPPTPGFGRRCANGSVSSAPSVRARPSCGNRKSSRPSAPWRAASHMISIIC